VLPHLGMTAGQSASAQGAAAAAAAAITSLYM
jgi:hypothetical protein